MEHLFLGLHFISLLYLGGIIAWFSYTMFMWAKAKTATLTEYQLTHFRKQYGISLGLTIITGVTVFVINYDKIIASYFLPKLFFIIVLIANGITLRKLFPLAIKKPYTELARHEKRQFFVSILLFGVSWLAAACLAGFILAE